MERSFGTVRDDGSKDGSRYSCPSGADAMVANRCVNSVSSVRSGMSKLVLIK